MKLIENLKSALYNIFQYGVSFGAWFFPTEKNTIIFKSYPDFSDNAWALYIYLKENRTDLDLYWINSYNSIIPVTVDKSKVLIAKDNYFKYFWKINRAKALFHTHGMACPKIKHKKQINVSLSHGGCPIKLGKTKGVSHYKKGTTQKMNYDYILCRGEGSVKINAYFWRVKESEILPLGMVRDDLFIKNIGEGGKNPFYNGHSQKLIVWMPTFRKSIDKYLSEDNSSTETGLPLFETDSLVATLNMFLSEIDVQLLVKIHPLQVDNPLFKKEFSNITFITNQTLADVGKQTYEVIGYSDALITDYSSVSFDYLITDKPIGYILDDMNKYLKDRGFLFEDPTEVMPGHHIFNVDQFHNFIMDIVNAKDEYIKKRKEIRDKYVGEIPDSTAKRVVEYFHI